jgi:hypothetical protein
MTEAKGWKNGKTGEWNIGMMEFWNKGQYSPQRNRGDFRLATDPH